MVVWMGRFTSVLLCIVKNISKSDVSSCTYRLIMVSSLELLFSFLSI